MEMILDDVSKQLSHTEILRHVSLRMTGGNVYGLRGYNGSGKTMLLRVMAGLMRPTSGKVFIDGLQLGRDMDFPPSIGVLLEDPAFLPDKTGIQNLEMIAELRGVVGRNEIRAVLQRVGLAPDDKRKYKKYSLGMKQRLGIACAVMEAPDIVLLDEPTNALDSDGVAQIRDMIREERERGALVVVASHEKELLYDLADEIYTVENGMITEREDRRTAE